MSGFDIEFLHREHGGKPSLSHRQWFAALPAWGKLSFLLVVLPAWVVIVFNSLTGNPKAFSSFIAFGIFAAVTIALIVEERRRKKAEENG